MLSQILQRLFLLNCLILLLVSCGSGSGGSTPQTQAIYVDATLGNDTTGNGSILSPYQSLSILATLSYNIPTTIYLKRGEVWYESLTLPASNITVDAYDTGNAPIIDGSQQVANWVSLGGGLYSAVVTLAAGEALGNLSEDGVMMTFVPWDTDFGTTFIGAADGSYSYDYATDILYILTTTPPMANTYLASVLLRGVYASDLTDITVRNLKLQYISLHGVEFQNCVRCVAENLLVSQVGGAVIGTNPMAPPDYLYAGNGIDFSNSCSDGQINNVLVSNVFDSCLSVEVYQSNSTAANISIQNATLATCGFAGVELSVLDNLGTNTNSVIQDVTASNIIMTNIGKGWSGRRYGTTGHGMRIVADQNAGSMSNINVQTLIVSNSAGDGIYIGGEAGLVSLHRIDSSANDGIGINIIDATATSLALKLSSSLIYNNGGNGVSYNAPMGAGLQIYQNTFYNNNTINLAVYNQNNLADIRNNLFYTDAAMTHFYSASTLVNPTVNYDCYNEPANVIGYDGSVYSLVLAFNMDTGLESNGLGTTNVGLTDPAMGIFTLPSTSDCADLGDGTVGVTEDYAGNPFASPPSSGAYQSN